MDLSYWELKSWFQNVDLTIVGSGIVGLNCAIKLKERFPKSSILILEKGILPQGASTKNAGFACFGSLSEIVADLNNHSEADVFNLVKKRIEGLDLLRKTIGDTNLDYQQLGGYELFLKTDTDLYDRCQAHLSSVNRLLFPLFSANVFKFKNNSLGFNNIASNYCFNPFEGLLDTGKMMEALLLKAQSVGIKILNNCTLKAFSDNGSNVDININNFSFKTQKLFIATNGFTSQLLEQPVKPARAQVLITKPINNLHLKGTFHLDEGYYYFRNVGNRLLLGGGRNLDFKTEETTNFGQTEIVQKTLETLLKYTILPNNSFEIEHRWSGIMGVGPKKTSIVKPISNNIFCGVRLGGMGVAIGSLVGKELANLLD